MKSATRYYAWAGQTVAVRTGDGFDDVSTLVNDHHGTASVSITNVSAQISRRYQSPFGESRGTAPTSWLGDHGFLDKPVDATGLTAIGARYYDPIIGRFVSVDPVMDLGDPQQWHGYAYAHSSPVTYSDPTGLREVVNDGLNNDTSEEIKKSVDHTRKNGGWGSASVSPPVSVPSNAGGGGHGYGGGGGSTGKPSEYSKAAAVSEEYAGPTADRINAEAIYAMIHLALAVGGMVPVVGELADGLDAAVCGIEGDAVCAALAGTGAIPVAGWGSGAIRTGKNVDRLVDAANAAGDSIRMLLTGHKKLQQKFKHAADFGVSGNYNTANRVAFGRAINQHVNKSGTRAIPGTYRGNPVTHYLDPKTGLNAMADESGAFVSGWRLSGEQLQNVIQRGSL